MCVCVCVCVCVCLGLLYALIRSRMAPGACTHAHAYTPTHTRARARMCVRAHVPAPLRPCTLLRAMRCVTRRWDTNGEHKYVSQWFDVAGETHTPSHGHLPVNHVKHARQIHRTYYLSTCAMGTLLQDARIAHKCVCVCVCVCMCVCVCFHRSSPGSMG